MSIILSVFMPFCVIFIPTRTRKTDRELMYYAPARPTHITAHSCAMSCSFLEFLYPPTPETPAEKFFGPVSEVCNAFRPILVLSCVFVVARRPKSAVQSLPPAQHTLAAHICAVSCVFPLFFWCPLSVKVPWKSPFSCFSCFWFVGSPSDSQAHTHMFLSQNGHVCLEVTAVSRQT